MKKSIFLTIIAILAITFPALAGEADLKMPATLNENSGILFWGFAVCFMGLIFSYLIFRKTKKLPVMKSMLDVAEVIFSTCKTYLRKQGKFLLILFAILASCEVLYFGFLQDKGLNGTILILAWTAIGILGSYCVAWFGIRMNTLANARMAFASLKRKPLKLLNIPLDSGMSIGVALVCIELVLMLTILLFMPKALAGACFIGFAIGESLGASVLRICGGIFTKIADVGSDLMKVVFKIGEDDPRNPGVIADCTGDNAGDSVGPTADGFETYGVTGVALVSFILLAIPNPEWQIIFLVWIFTMRILMVITSVVAFWINKGISKFYYGKSDDLDFEKPLTNLVWIASIFSIIATFVASYFIIGPNSAIGQINPNIWIALSVIISCGTFGGALIPEITKIFTSTKSGHVKEIVNAGDKGGASLTILSGLVTGNFASFWLGFAIIFLMLVGFIASTFGLGTLMSFPAIFAFGLVAFGLLGMGPVTIAVDSYGPVTDNAQSVYELSLIEDDIEQSEKEIQKEFGFKPDFGKAKHYLEANDGAGNTFKATAKPVLIATAVIGATTMIFSLILVIKNVLGVEPTEILNILNPFSIMGLIAGGAVIFWFSGATMQAVTTGAHRAVEFIKEHINLNPNAPKKASLENSNKVVKICTQYAQNGMVNIFAAVFLFTLSFAFIASYQMTGTPAETNAPIAFFVFYLIGITVAGLLQACFMANAGGAWDNAKKIVEVDLKQKGTPLHDATVVGDTVGDPFKDTSSVAMNPIIKFTTLFGLLAIEIGISAAFRPIAVYAGVVCLILALYFVWRSFYKMRIPAEKNK